MPRKATLAQRLAWHREHQKRCACRPIPAKLRALMAAKRAVTRASKALSTRSAARTKEAEASARSSAATATKPRPTRASRPAGRLPSVAQREIDPQFARVVAALANEPGVTYGGKGFGSSALKVHGKLFATISSQGKFVAKLPKSRVLELVERGQGELFDPGHGRKMREWIELSSHQASWLALAREAYRFVGGATRTDAPLRSRSQ